MTAAKHTPGPWMYERGVVTTDGADHESTICQLISAHTVGGYAPLAERQRIADANGELIARAPDLLAENERLRAALRRVMDWWMNTPAFDEGSDEMPAEIFDEARAALAGGGK